MRSRIQDNSGGGGGYILQLLPFVYFVQNNKLVGGASDMVLCLMVNWGNESEKTTGISYSRAPAIVRNQGKGAEKLPAERRPLWILSA